ncbi:MAG: polyketide synthase dehydratase domain-containing protein [Alphaproteobacteria bacterium]|nr:polyketide synthase dehydratase domain-containing protein [Alphaproteobacteria bacterium]
MPVVPVVLVLEWFARAARALLPGLSLRRLEGVKVLRGVKVTDFKGQGILLQVRAKQISNGDGAKVQLELRGADGGLHYAATARLGVGSSAPADAGDKPNLGPWSSQIYGGTLFHGPEFQVIRAMEGVSAEGIAAELATTTQKGWAGKAWQTDVAALDGGLQLALLWTREVLGGDSLPTSVAAYEAYAEGVPEGPVRAELSRRQVHDKRTVSDIRFTGADGRLLAALLGVETHLLPSA